MGLFRANFMQLTIMEGGAFRSPAFYPMGDSLETRSYCLGSYVSLYNNTDNTYQVCYNTNNNSK